MSRIAIIGGTGLVLLEGAEIYDAREVNTPYGSPSSTLSFGNFGDKEIIFLHRHGSPHLIPPHKVNYRANIHALKENDVKNIIAVNAVGGITSEMSPGRIVIPEQIIDYTHDRNQTFYENNLSKVTHIDFTNPYSAVLREQLTEPSVISELNIFVGGVYAATQGPRLETAAEIRRLEKDGCDIVGMTGMPETALARELDIHYVCLALVVNWAAGKTDEEITTAIIEKHLKDGLGQIKLLLKRFISSF